MRQPFTYRDAVALLGGESPLVALLDKGSAAAMLGLSAIDLFDARAEAVRLGDGLVRGLRDRVKGLHRYDRTQRLAAAHAVIVLTAFFEVLGEAELLSELTREDLKSVGVPFEVRSLVDAPWPMPGPQRPYELVLDDLLRHYSLITGSVLRLVSGLAVWDELGETRQDRLARDLPARAVRRYEELFRRLAADFPEVACWASLAGGRATRDEVRTLARGLAGLRDRLSAISSGRSPSDRLRALVEANRAALGRPVVTSADVPGGMTIPSLDLGYVDPGFRVISPRAQVDPGSERRDDLDAFLAGHLTLPQATDAPLLVLGQPGAGKSVLTRVLAARLPEGEFLPLRVELRHVPADADVLAQIEHGIRDAL
ncbi:MAG: hypothetical protein HOY71_46935, partial [Nonomuraea sp.]|nr:hypothetical protein [Nonomuraea sp.]